MSKTLKFTLLTIMITFMFTLIGTASAVKYECETASVGTDKAYKTEADKTNASGGVYASSTNNVMFVYENVPLSNKVVLRCAGQQASNAGITFSVKAPGETEWTVLETVKYVATTSWNMSDPRDIEINYDIPAGSSFAHQCPTGINYDYVDFSYVEATEVKTGRIEAETSCKIICIGRCRGRSGICKSGKNHLGLYRLCY